MRADISEESKIRSEIIESLNQTLDSDIPKLYDLIKQESQVREDCD